MEIEKRENFMVLKYVDSNMNIFRGVISRNDFFLDNFCEGDFEKMEKILANYTIDQKEDFCSVKIIEPFVLEYFLLKDDENPNIRNLYKKIQHLSEENIFLNRRLEKLEKIVNKNEIFIKGDLKEQNNEIFSHFDSENLKLQMKISNIEIRLGNSVLLPGYHGGILPKNLTYLSIKIGQFNSGNCTDFFDGDTLEPISQLTELEGFTIEFCSTKINIDLSPLAKCKKLRRLNFMPRSRTFTVPYIGPNTQIIEYTNGSYQIIQKND